MLASLVVAQVLTVAAAQGFTVEASREGLSGHRTATGHVIRGTDIFVALPDSSALNKTVEIVYKGQTFRVKVLDIGPWHIDDPYWVKGHRPRAERNRGPNHAGIDISDGLWRKMGLSKDDGKCRVTWRFVE